MSKKRKGLKIEYISLAEIFEAARNIKKTAIKTDIFESVILSPVKIIEDIIIKNFAKGCILWKMEFLYLYLPK